MFDFFGAISAFIEFCFKFGSSGGSDAGTGSGSAGSSGGQGPE